MSWLQHLRDEPPSLQVLNWTFQLRLLTEIVSSQELEDLSSAKDERMRKAIEHDLRDKALQVMLGEISVASFHWGMEIDHSLAMRPLCMYIMCMVGGGESSKRCRCERP